MAFKLRDVVAKFVPWEFPVEIDAMVYQTRPVLIGELLKLSTLGKDPKAADQVRDLVRGWFKGAAPDVSLWTMDEVQALMTGMQEYAAARAKKNAPIIKRAMAEIL
ncbi:MAG: hypothetical protein ACM359_07070 [Bacillota bacterium]